MLEINKKKFIFKIKEIWFADFPFKVKNCDYVIFRDCKNKADAKGFKRGEFTTLTLDLSRDLESIWQSMDKSSCRYVIKKAEKENIIAKTSEKREEFYRLNKDFRKTKGLGMGMACSLDFIKKNGTLFSAEHSGEMISGSLFLEDKENIRWLLGASKRFEKGSAASLAGGANRLMLWEAIKYAKEKGLKEFDFGGISAKKEGPKNNFKQSFGGELTTHYIYEKDYSFIFKFLKTIYFFFNKRDF